MNIIKSAILVMALLSTSAFADQPTSTKLMMGSTTNQDQLFPAFAGVETSSVSDEELHQVSGEMAPVVYYAGLTAVRVGAFLVANKVTCGRYRGCVAR